MSMTTRSKVLLIVVVFAFLFYASYQYIVTDQLAAIKTKRNELAQVQNQINRIESLPALKMQLDEEIKILEDEKERLKKSYFSLIQEQEEIILLVNEFLSNPGLMPNVTFSPPNNEKIGNTQVSSMSISMSYEATYPDLLDILRIFWQFDRKIIITQISMSAASGEILRGSFQLVLYDIAQITGELDRIFSWIEKEDDLKTNPLTPAKPLVPDNKRYKYIES